jgi:hypothetical protein
MQQQNSACSLSTYKGGLRCCADGVFLTEFPDYSAPFLGVVLKFTFHFEDARPETRPASIAGCCDIVGDLGNLGDNYEYDIPACNRSDGSECVHKLTTVQMIDMFRIAPADPAWNHTKGKPEDLVDLGWAYAHQHMGGLGMDLYDDLSGVLLCESRPIYGKGETPGDEKGYVVAMTACTWGQPPLKVPPRLRRDQRMRIVAYYNSTRPHRGVMSQWQISKVDIPQEQDDVLI